MSLLCSGLSHRTAPVALRERLAFPPGEARALLGSAWFRAAGRDAGLAEFAVLSTCNRTEIYAAPLNRDAVPAGGTEALGQMLARAVGLSHDLLAPHLYTHCGVSAVRHLCRVAAGLDSMVVGEMEVLGQVGAALGDALESGAAGRVLDAAFHAALRAGRRARSETAIARRPASVAAEAGRLLRERLPARPQSAVLVLGTGSMGRSVARVLAGAPSLNVRVAGRSSQQTSVIASELGIEAVAWDSLGGALAKADAVVAATSAPEPVITAAMVELAHHGRPRGRRSVFVDVAVPRNVEPSVRAIPGVELYDMDNLQARIDRNIDDRRTEVPLVEVIIEQELAHFENWRRGTQLSPLLASLREKSESIRLLELERHLGRFADAGPELRDAFDAFSRDLVTKLLHEPSRRLRAESDPARSRASAEVLRELFDLSNGSASRTSDLA